MKTKLLVRPLVSAVFDSLHAGLFSYMQRAGLVLSAAHTAVETATGTTYGVCATLPASYDASGYAATGLTYTAIGSVSDFPEWGLSRATGKFNPIAGAVQKYDGTPDYGGGAMVMADIVGDAGQAILKTASESTTRAHVSIKGTRPDGAVFYLDVLVSKWSLSAAKENTPYLRNCDVQVCLAPVIVAAS